MTETPETYLMAEAHKMLAALEIHENECIKTRDVSWLSDTLTDDQWQALISLHQTLQYKYYDFFLVSRYPIASMGGRLLASEYNMPARFWSHGIHSFLEIMRERLPESQVPMLEFMHLSYSLLGLFEETIRYLRGVWVECKGDVARYL